MPRTAASNRLILIQQTGLSKWKQDALARRQAQRQRLLM